MNNRNINIGKHTKAYLTKNNNTPTVDIFNFIRSLITQLIYDSENSDVIKSIQKTNNSPSYIALLPSSDVYIVQFKFFTIDQNTKNKKTLTDDYSYSDEELQELARIQKITYNNLYPYIQEILKNK